MNSWLSRHIYLFLKVPTSFCYRMYYRRFQVDGYDENVENDQATILVSNHQNALSDAMNVIYSVKRFRRPLFLTRADIFKKSLLPIFNLFRMSPIYRTRDGVDVREANDQVFETCVDFMMRKDCIGIFPEGSHLGVSHIRPLKKGLARIVFAAAERSQFKLPIRIVPAGQVYEDYFAFQKSVLINYAPAIHAEAYYAMYQENPSKALVELTKDVRYALMDASLHIESEEDAPFIEQTRKVFTEALKTPAEIKTRDMQAELQAAKKIATRVLAWKETVSPDVFAEAKANMQQYHQSLKQLNLRDTLVREKPATLLKQAGTFLFLLITSPIFGLGLLFNYLPYHVVGTRLHKMFKDPHFTGSIRALGSFAVFGLWYLLLGLVAGIALGTFWAFLLTCLTGGVTGMFALLWAGVLKKWNARNRIHRMQKAQDPAWVTLTGLRATLKNWFDGLPDIPAKVYSKSR